MLSDLYNEAKAYYLESDLKYSPALSRPLCSQPPRETPCEAVAAGTEWTPSADELLGGIKVLLRGQDLEAVSLGDLRYSLARHLGAWKNGGNSVSSGRHSGSIQRAFESKKMAFSLEGRAGVPGTQTRRDL